MKQLKPTSGPIIDLLTLIVILIFATFSIVYIISPQSTFTRGSSSPGLYPTSKDESKSEENFFNIKSSHKYTALYVDEVSPDFKSKPYFTGYGSTFELMVPAREMLSFIGLSVESKNGGKAIISYKKNIFVKIYANSKVAYINGCAHSLPYKTAVKNGVVYCPLSFIASSFNYEVKEKGGIMYAKSKSKVDDYKQFEGLYYKSTFIPALQATLYVPEYWKSLSDNSYHYGYKEGKEKSGVRVYPVTVKRNMKDADLSRIADEFIRNSLTPPQRVIGKGFENLTGLSTFNISVRNGDVNEIIYIVRKNSNIYAIRFTAESADNLNFFLTSFKNAISTFRTDDVGVDYNSDYYIERPLFFDIGMKVNSSFFAGQTVYRSFEFKADCKRLPPGKRIVAIVEKSGNKSRFPISGKDGKISGRIYLPFGLGIHNITIAQVDATISDTQTYSQSRLYSNILIEMSMINTSSTVDTFIVPGFYIDSDNPDIKNTSFRITHKSLKQIEKSADLFNYICNEYKMTRSNLTNQASSTLKLKEGTSKELNLLYCALLRAVEIPAGVSSYKDDNIIKFITEVQINGKWIVVDLTGGVIAKSNNMATNRFFAIDYDKFYSNKKNIVKLNY